MKEKITVIGAGAWGTAIANLLAQNKHDVCAISDIKEISEEINQKNTHLGALPGVDLEKNLKCSTDLKQNAQNADLIFIVVPSNVVPIIVDQLSAIKLQENCGFVICTKGLDHGSLKFFHQIIEEKISGHSVAVLSGPNFAIEVALRNPTITNIASLDLEFANKVIAAMKNDYFKPIYLQDILIAEISSVVKNIMAIACGINDGIGLGENSKAALIVQGVQEIELLAKGVNTKESCDLKERDIIQSKAKDSKGFLRSFILRIVSVFKIHATRKNKKRINTKESCSFKLNNAAGFGDIFLTCSTTKSRNNSLGSRIGKGEKYSDLRKEKTYEGAINAESINKLAKKLNIELKLCQTIHEILETELSVEEIKQRLVKSAL